MRINQAVKLLDYVFVLRPTLFFPVWTVYAAGYFASQRFAPGALNGAGQPDQAALPLALALSALMGAAFILNQLCDVATDTHNHKLFLIAQRHISPAAAWLQTVLLTGAGLLVAFQHSHAHGLLFLAIFLLTGILYSVAPFQWKDRPIRGLLANAGGALLIFTAGWWAVRPAASLPLWHALPYMLAVGAVYLYTTLLDLAGDAQTHKRTFAVCYGWRATVITGCLCELAATALAWQVNDPVIFYPALLSAPFFIAAACKQGRPEVSRAIKLPILFLALAIGCKMWQYFLVLAVVFFVSKWYYQQRFGLKYPSLQAD
ncbi:MAG: UbiA family prenyltransferase [candidate division KSB1 bacterium]|nr:UbiA family prenyltransferase [candidate division KSB1 bacterium]MDZ7276029.1 UbiA family prenyltransferase [candidate division KSB1 bacterium]MDZ7285689.1 UbiA family prenyltransferase [candidate division KSB1 bacterium]MDZ7298721.1 UbiA family prenyltransferase [candidate division KSB1 bacterium]MDZ7309522.1 UbiA family prenyltransferase [candidate division KSB1 bacterium]